MRCVHEVVPYITKAAEQSLFYHISSLHQTGPRAHKLVNQYQIIVFEDLQVKNLTKAPAPKQDEKGKYVPNGAAAKAGLNKSILDAGWSEHVYTDGERQGSMHRQHDGNGAAFNMNTNRVTNEAIAYLAGLFDGEGSINIFKQSNKKDRINSGYFLEISIG